MTLNKLKIDTNDINVINGVVDLNDLMPSTEKPYYIGIPYMDELDPVIGHYFFNDRKKLYIFPYSSKDELRELPKFSLRLLMMTDPSGIFEKNVNNLNNTINFDNIDEFKNFKNIPKFISLYSKKNERGSILLKQRPTHIKVKFPNNKPSFNKKVIRKLSDDNENLKCSFFVPFESDNKIRSNSNNNFIKLPKIFHNNNTNAKGKH
ncbi:5381_t:CDS:2 [Rhizophagus irregularis]|nr:5381_t:CDS:2 [Rhizophagus irregularis]